MRAISYNLRKHSASAELVDLTERYGVDVLCLQEADTGKLPHTLGHLELADSTKGNRLGLAIYYHDERFAAKETKAFELKKSMHDYVLAPAHERLIGVRLVDHESKHEIAVGSFHAAPLTASNSLRRNQIRAGHEALLSLGGENMTLMMGDFNYPFFTRSLMRHLKETGYELTLSNRRTYSRYKLFKGHFDFATSLGLDIQSVETLPQGESDHLPILVTAEYMY
ncbi:endonuclease/exonuclease/phosphatase family protein [Arthrobacter mobilis]|uniref:Endonuclease/exonuclease/phosphatase family protein n=1 Tax=Arthrobacter mobilis TaxID=2724944 RepID=A0A7X6K5N9_9MICC|nr:endonuclease/exonuclease/phosphatase family protein [Arthrobacter mobilis]NKX54489.1 endonuclease/exonuclease/phosphatase family protein [Arthrobacter mobilis]